MPARLIWTVETALPALKNTLTQYGADIAALKYDDIPRDGKPPRGTLLKLFPGLSWDQIKAKALPSQQTNTSYLMRQNKRLLERLEHQQNITQVILDNCLSSIAGLNISPVPIPKKVQAKENLSFFALRSDAQVGQYTDEEWTQGLSHYNADTYKERVDKWTEKIILFKEQDGPSLGLNKLVLNHLGDQVEGERIYKGQPFNLDINLADQLFFSLEVESNAYLTLAQYFPKIEIFCVIGNHGRPGKKGEHHQKTNFDYIFYRFLQMLLKPQKNITVYVAQSPSMLVQHGDYKFLLNHGDTAVSWNGIPYYGLDRAYKKLNELYGGIHYELVGHHHVASNLADKILINGSLPGGSDLSINKMHENQIPKQKIFYFHPVHGINRESNLKLAEPVKLTADKNGIYTPYK